MNRIEYDWPSAAKVSGASTSFDVIAHLYLDNKQTLSSIQQLSIVPRKGSAHPHESNMFVQDIEFTPVSDYYWKLGINYGNTETYTDSEEFVSPWKKRPEIRYTLDVVQVVAQKYYKNDEATKPTLPILNAVGDPFMDPPVIPRGRMKIDLTWWCRDFKDSLVNTYWNTINLKQMIFDARLYPAKTLWLTLIMPNPYYGSTGSKGYQVNAEMIYDPLGFNYVALQAGYRAKVAGKIDHVRTDATTGKYTLDKTKGDKVSYPVLLNADGTLLSDDPIAMAASTTQVYTDMRYLKLADWKGLAIPELKANEKKFGMSR